MRAALLTLIVTIILVSILRYPFNGVLLWHWLSLMSPQELAYGFSFNFPFLLTGAIITLIMWLVSSEPKLPPFSAPTIVLVVFTVWITITTLFALAPDAAWLKWQEVVKILLMTFVTMAMTNTRERLRMVIWVAAVSIGIYGARGGLFSILTGANFRVFGPEGTFIGDNNTIGMAFVMMIPIMLFLYETEKHRILKFGCLGVAGLTGIATLFTYSRGAFLGLAAIAIYMWLGAKKRLRWAILAVALGFMLIPMIPNQWFERIDTIQTYEEDGSATGRLRQWHIAILIASDYAFGGGFKVFVDEAVDARYADRVLPGKAREAHSIFFQILGEQGVIGLVLFVSLLATTFFTCIRMRRNAKPIPGLEFYERCGWYVGCGLVGFMVTGAFLSQAYFDLWYLFLAIVVCAARQCTEQAKAYARTRPLRGTALRLSEPRPVLAGQPRGA